MTKHKLFTLAETGVCPLCSAAMVQDNRIRLTAAIGWVVTRAYVCGSSLGGLIGTPMVMEVECDRAHWRKSRAA